jgi:predicted MFS family arabinose efflux permease
MVVPFMTLYLTGKDMQRSLSDAGLVMGLFGLGSIVGAFFGGKLSDRIGFYKVQLITLFGGGIMFLILGQVKSFPLICLCTFILSLVNEAFRPANSSAIAFYSTIENRTRSYSLNRLSINLGWAVGASVGGILASIDYELLFWVDGFTNLTAAVLLAYFLKPSGTPRVKTEPTVQVTPAQSAYRDKIYLWFILLVVLFAFCFFQLFTTIPKYFRDNLHLGERYIGFIMAINGGIIVALEMVVIFVLEGKKRLQVYISAGLIVCALAFMSLLLKGDPKLISLCMILLITAGEIAAMPFMNTIWTLRSNEKNRGQYAALYTMAWGVAQVLGPFTCSYIAEAFGFDVMFIFISSLLCIAAVGFYYLPSKQ